MDEIRKNLDTAVKNEKENFQAIDDERAGNVDEKNHLGVFQKMVKNNDLFNRHKTTLEDLYV